MVNVAVSQICPEDMMQNGSNPSFKNSDLQEKEMRNRAKNQFVYFLLTHFSVMCLK